jgi:hypothetical protein
VTRDREYFAALLAGTRILFWTCLNKDHKHVTWTGDVATCDTCGLTSEMTARFAREVQEYERERIYTELGNEHHVIFTEDGWTVEHSVECRLSGHMHECAYYTAIASIAGQFEPGFAGRWRIAAINGDGKPELERAKMPGGEPA